jgi:hypothetical protein
MRVMMKRLYTASDVVKALGGHGEVMRLTKANKQQLWNWEVYFESFPPRTYWIMSRELARKGFHAPAHLWKMIGAQGGKNAA